MRNFKGQCTQIIQRRAENSCKRQRQAAAKGSERAISFGATLGASPCVYTFRSNSSGSEIQERPNRAIAKNSRMCVPILIWSIQWPVSTVKWEWNVRRHTNYSCHSTSYIYAMSAMLCIPYIGRDQVETARQSTVAKTQQYFDHKSKPVNWFRNNVHFYQPN